MFFGYVFVFMQKFYEFQHIEYFKKHCSIYIIVIMLIAICFTTNKTFHYITLSFK